MFALICFLHTNQTRTAILQIKAAQYITLILALAVLSANTVKAQRLGIS